MADRVEKGLKCEGLSIHFGGIRALDDVSFDVSPGEIVSLIGPNGSGKTTLLNCTSRIYNPNSGSLFYNGIDLLKRKSHHLQGLGISRTFQNLSLFNSMTVRDNLLIGLHSTFRSGLVPAGLGFPSVRRFEKKVRERATEIMKLLDLEDYKLWPVVALPYGTRKKIDIGKALMSNPSLLLLDEPASGLSSEDIEELSNLIVRINEDQGMSVLLIEHNIRWVMEVSDRVIALNYGKVIANGTPVEVQHNQQVIESYVGSRADSRLA